MQINDTYWGGMGVTNLYYNFDVTTKTMLEGFNDNTIPLNQTLDLSISPWAINPNADILGLQYCLMTTHDNGVTVTAHTYDLLDIAYDSQTGVPFYFIADNTFSSGNYWNDFYWTARNAYNQAILEETDAIKYRTQKPIVRKFDYSRLVCVPIIHYTQRPTPSYDATSELWIIRRDLTDDWLTSHYITGISFNWYYATDENAPNMRYPLGNSFMMATLANFKDITNYISGANKTYSNPFLANCLTMPYIGTNYGTRFDCGTYNSYDYSISYYTADIDAYNAKFDLSALPYPILHTGSNYAGDNTLLKTLPISRNTYTSYAMSYLDTDGMTSTDVLDYIYKQIAYLGVWICDSGYSVRTEILGSSAHWMIGEIGDDGVTTGKYAWGTDALSIANASWINPWEKSGYQGRNEDPTNYDDSQTSVITSSYGDPAYNSKEYLMSENALSQLLRVLNEFKLNVSGELPPDWVVNAFGDTDPVNTIISVIKYPFDIVHNFNGNGTDVVITGSNIGSWFRIANASIAVSVVPEIPSTPTLYTIDLTSNSEIYEIDWTNTNFKYGTSKIPYYDKFKCFLDYEPYCTANLYIPFCGSVKIDPELFCGHEIGVDYVVSPVDGTAKAFIKRDNLIIDTLTGNIGTKIEINSTDDLLKSNNIQQLNATIQAQKMNTAKKWSNVSIGAIGGAVVSGGVGAVVGGIASAVNATFDTAQNNLSIEQKQMQIDNAETPFKQLQSGGGYLSQCDEYAIRLVVYRPETLPTYTFDNWGDYGKMRGFATYETGVLNNYSGYIECSNIILDDISATDSEKKQIFELLKGGVIL